MAKSAHLAATQVASGRNGMSLRTSGTLSRRSLLQTMVWPIHSSACRFTWRWKSHIVQLSENGSSSDVFVRRLQPLVSAAV